MATLVVVSMKTEATSLVSRYSYGLRAVCIFS